MIDPRDHLSPQEIADAEARIAARADTVGEYLPLQDDPDRGGDPHDEKLKRAPARSSLAGSAGCGRADTRAATWQSRAGNPRSARAHSSVRQPPTSLTGALKAT